MADELLTTNLLNANLAIERIDRALRQEQRLQAAHATLVEAEDAPERSAPLASRRRPDLDAEVEDHLYFMVLAVNQAIKAAAVMTHRGESMPVIGQTESIAAWRNFLEHWDDPAKGRPIASMKRWGKVSDEAEPGLSRSGYGGALSEVSGVRLPELRADLQALRQAASSVSEREWDSCYITAHQAAALLDMDVRDFEAMPTKPMHLDFGEEYGVRNWRDWVEARRDGRIVPPGWEEHLAT